MRQRKMKQRHLTARQRQPEEPILKESISVQMGEIVIRHPITLLAEHIPEIPKARQGKVVYIHPKGRFHVVEFGEGAQAVRESFFGIDR